MSGTHRSLASSNGVKSSGAVLNTMHLDAHEENWWLVLQFTGLMALYSSRNFLVISIVPMSKEMGWDERECGTVLSSFYWGYILTQVIGGNLSNRFGGDLIQWTAAIVWSLSTLSIVYVAHVSTWLVVLVRFLAGLAQGMHYPALVSLIGHKVPEHARTKFFGRANAGSLIGTVCVGLVGSLMKWKHLVIVVGCIGLVWTACLQLVSASHHKKVHYRLSDGMQPTASRLKLHVQQSTLMASCNSVPWRELLTHSSVIAYLCAFMTECSYLYVIPTWAPTYFSEVFPNRPGSASFYNAAPALVMATGSYTGGLLINYLIVQEYDVTFVRKMACFICLFGSGICLLIISIFGRGDSNFPFTVLVFLISSYCYGYNASGISINSVDLAPTYSGSLYGVANTLGALLGVFAVPLIGYILRAADSWALVFILQSGILFSGCLIFLAYGSAHRLQLSTAPNK